MGVFDFLKRGSTTENRSLTNYAPTSSLGTIYSVFGNDTPITEEDALKIPAVVACIELIAGSIAQLPLYLYKENENGEIERVMNDRRVFLMNSEPNDMLNGYSLKKKIVKDYLLYGASHTKMEKLRNDVVELYPFDMKNVQVTKYLKDGYKHDADIRLMSYSTEGQMETVFKPHELLTILKESEDGITSKGILAHGYETLTLALNEVEYSSNILKNSALPVGVVETAAKLSETAVKRLRKAWEALYSGPKNAGRTVVLEEGLTYKPISIKPNDLQLVDSKKVTISEVARLFNVPESMLNADANKYASNEQNNLHFLQYTLAPILIAIEIACDKSMLLEDEKEQGYFFRFDVSEILRTTEKEKIESITEALKSGLFSFNEARAKLDYPKLEDNYFLWSLGNVLFNPDTKEMIVPNMQGSGDLDDGPQNPKLDDMKVGNSTNTKQNQKEVKDDGKNGIKD